MLRAHITTSSYPGNCQEYRIKTSTLVLPKLYQERGTKGLQLVLVGALLGPMVLLTQPTLHLTLLCIHQLLFKFLLFILLLLLIAQELLVLERERKE